MPVRRVAVRCTPFLPDALTPGQRAKVPNTKAIGPSQGPIDSASIEATIAADQLCDELGMDTISTGGSIGFAYELYERGILTKRETDGLDLVYGNHSAMIDLVNKIARREGFGSVLAEGSARAAQIIGKGAEAYAMQVKGVELAVINRGASKLPASATPPPA